MKIITCLFIIFLCILSAKCSKISDEYPESIIANHLQEEFDVAKFEAYKLVGRFDCFCEGSPENNRSAKYGLLSLDLNLVGLDNMKDTTIIFLGFVASDQQGIPVPVVPIMKTYTDCFDIVGMVFINGAMKPNFALLGEAVMDYNNTKHTEGMDEHFKKCLKDSNVNLNKWLKNYLRKNQYY